MAAGKTKPPKPEKMTGGQFRSEMKFPKPGVYLFYGDEGFLKKRELDYLRMKLCPDRDMAAFSHFIFTPDNYALDALLSAILAPAMLTDFKLVELNGIQFAELRKKEDTEGLEEALKAAAESSDTITVIYTTPENFDPGDAKSPSSIMKLLSKYAAPVEFAHESGTRLVMWIQKHFSSDKLIAEPSECSYLIEVSGHDMATLSGEIDKLCAYLHAKEREKLEKADIDLICPHNKEIGAFEFADAILDANNEKAFYILADLRSRGEAPQLILGSMIKLYTDLVGLKLCADAGLVADDAAKRMGLHPYVAKLRMAKAKSCDRRALEGIIMLCSEADAAMKTSRADEYILLERLIIQASGLRKRKLFN